MAVLQLDEFKTRQRVLWDAGAYHELTPYIAEVGELVVARAGIAAGMSVLDVACATGNVARPAARAGARVVGLDLVPKLLEYGRAKAQAQGLDIEWREGDAENLPFEDGRFDRVLSTFGHMFAPRHQRTADEMARVCRRGGAIVTATWLPDGTVGEIFAVVSSYMPPPPDYASPPVQWGREDYIRERFAAVATGFEFERHVNWIEWESLDSYADFFMSRFGPLVTAKGASATASASCANVSSTSGARRTPAREARLVSPNSIFSRSSGSDLPGTRSAWAICLREDQPERTSRCV